MNALVDKTRLEFKLGDYATAPAAALADPGLLPRVQEYRRLLASRMLPLDREGIGQKIPAGEYHVSRKIDGEFTVLAWRNGTALTINPGGTARVGLPLLEEAARRLTQAGVRDALVAGELYALREASGRPRVHDVATVARNPQSAADLQRLRFAAFDILALDGAAWSAPYAETWRLLTRWLGGGELTHPVEAQLNQEVAGIQKLFAAWVDGEGAEGLVVRSDAAGLFKIKPRHTLDLAVLGFSESLADRQGMLHDLLLGVRRPDETLQVLGRVGGGFTEDQRREMLSDLKDMVVPSEYAEVNADHVAYQMVQPEWVVEVSCLDLLAETTRGGPINRMVLDYRPNGAGGYQVVTKLPLATIISPQFVRRRDDKQVRPDDCGLRQVSGIVEVPLLDRDPRKMVLPASEVLRREVYTKEAKGQTMVRKFLLWKTHKEQASDEFPAYVLHFTDFSPNRKDPLARELRVSSSAEQMARQWDALREENVKAGWSLAAALPASGAAAVAAPAAPSAPAIAESTAESTAAPAEPPAGELAPSERKPRGRKKKSG